MRAHLAAAAAAILAIGAACGGLDAGGRSGNRPGDPSTGQAGAQALLVRLDPEPIGSNCVAGGTAVRAGLDASGDGLLQDGEVAKTTYVCAGPVRPLLTRTEPVGAGPACPAGGTRVLAGRDESGDGTLQDGEVQGESLVCAPPPDPAAPVLSVVVEEPPGGSCYYGGQAVSSGADANGDGFLDPSEVTTVIRLCEAGREGLASFTITSQEDLELFRRAWVVRGDVVVSSPTLETVELDPDKITGSILVQDNPRLRWFGLGRLGGPQLNTFVRGHLTVTDNPALKTLAFPRPLSPSFAGGTVEGDLVIARNPKLVSLDWGLEGLGQVHGALVLEDNAALEGVSLNGLRRVGRYLRIARNTALATSARRSSLAIQSIGEGIDIDGVGGPGASLVFPALSTVGGSIRISRAGDGLVWFAELRLIPGSVTIEESGAGFLFDRLLAIDGNLSYLSNAALRSAGWAPQLERIGGDLSLTNNAQLRVLGLAALRSVRAITVAEAPRLRTCELTALAARTGATVYAIGTDDLTPCP